MYIRPVNQPSLNSTIEAICEGINGADLKRIDLAVAYITRSGFREFDHEIRNVLGKDWDQVEKRWITSFDYLRTEPAALRSVIDMPNASLRIHNAEVVKRAGCIPSIPFHPKVFILKGSAAERILAGSGNMSRSGLRRGYEAGLMIGFSKPHKPNEAACRKAVSTYREWFKSLWAASEPSSTALLDAYRKSFQSTANLKNPTPTDDDVIPSHSGQLSGDDLRKLRACDNLWIEAGNITKNLGPTRPGNQLMMKRLTRVFFGVPASDVPQNSPLTHIRIAFGGNEERPCSLTFSDNGMDKLTLPMPATFGPPHYDNQNLLFTRVSTDLFALKTGTNAQKKSWRVKSQAVSGDFLMASGGRRWGVF
jgi:HKD family nuclease